MPKSETAHKNILSYPMFSFQMVNPAESILDSLLQLIDSDPAHELCFQSIILVSERLDLGTIYNEKGMNIKGQRNKEEKDKLGHKIHECMKKRRERDQRDLPIN